jgi:hypothetical protein
MRQSTKTGVLFEPPTENFFRFLGFDTTPDFDEKTKTVPSTRILFFRFRISNFEFRFRFYRFCSFFRHVCFFRDSFESSRRFFFPRRVFFSRESFAIFIVPMFFFRIFFRFCFFRFLFSTPPREVWLVVFGVGRGPGAGRRAGGGGGAARAVGGRRPRGAEAGGGGGRRGVGGGPDVRPPGEGREGRSRCACRGVELAVLMMGRLCGIILWATAPPPPWPVARWAKLPELSTCWGASCPPARSIKLWPPYGPPPPPPRGHPRPPPPPPGPREEGGGMGGGGRKRGVIKRT